MKYFTTEKFSLSYCDYGSPDGYPILMQHGLIASVKEESLFRGLIAAGARVICMVRPGYAESSPYEMNCIGEWGQLVLEFARALNLDLFDVLGSSSGAPYSYAMGVAMPDKVRNIFIFSGVPALYDDQVITEWPYPIDRHAGLAEMKQLAHDLFFSDLSAADLARNDMADSMAHEGFGVALDLCLRVKDWGFKLEQVRQPVYLRHARFDTSVPLAAVELSVAMLAKAELKVDETDIHFSEETLDAFFNSQIIPRLPAQE